MKSLDTSNLFMHTLNKYLLSIYYTSDTIVGGRDTAVGVEGRMPILMSPY